VMALIDLSDGMIIGARQSRYTEYFSWITWDWYPLMYRCPFEDTSAMQEEGWRDGTLSTCLQMPPHKELEEAPTLQAFRRAPHHL
jgi:hypothetical protein